MKAARWIGWLVATCVCLSEARYKIRRPLPPPQIYKKSWPIGHRISMGNTIHINTNFPQKRPPPPHKPNNYRIRRPPVFNVVPNGWKTHHIPVMGVLNNHAALPQRPPVKEFHSLSKVPEYSPEYRPEAIIIPPTHRGGIDDDKGPIHTIPAPNLSLADKPYNLVEGKPAEKNHEDASLRRPFESNYNINFQGTSATPQRPVTNPTPTQHQYEVTETNDINIKDYHTIPPAYFTPEFDSTRVSTVVNPEVQANEVYLNHAPASNTGLIGTNNIQFGQSNVPMQTNLHSSLSVGFPGTASQAASIGSQQLPDLHVGHPAAAGPPLSATQLYDLLNTFPQQLSEQYTSGQQPQLQQHILQQQLGQFFQTDANGVTRFSQPQMHSFNYDEQANKQQHQRPQQQILIGQDYGSGRVTADYNLEPESSGNGDAANNVLRTNEELNYPAEVSDQQENNIEYEQTSNQRGQSTYYNKVKNPGSLSTQFYTTLPNREAAEKLAALAAAGNVNSHLIGQLKKQKEFQQDEPIPENHKDEDFQENEQQQEEEEIYDQRQRFEEKRKQAYQQQKFREQQIRQEQENEQYEQRYRQQQRFQQQRQNNQQESESDKHPLRIMVPDTDEQRENKDQSDSAEKETFSEDYEYENDEPDNSNSNLNKATNDASSYEQSANAEFGTRIKKTGK